MQNDLPTSPPPARLLSLDALRGFDMFWIIGGAKLFAAAEARIDSPAFTAITNNLAEHVEWEGFHFHDMIFPLFLFIIGVAIPFALGRRVEAGAMGARAGKWKLTIKIVRRTALMFLLGLIYSGLLQFKGLDHLRIMGVLQRLALGYGIAAMIVLYTGIRTQAIAAAVCLVGYWAAMRFIPVPGFGPGDFSPQGNLANYIDRVLFLPGQLYEIHGDPEGLFSTIPAVATAILGALTGHWLRSTRPPMRKAVGMAAAGVVLIGAGYLWSLDFPIIKKIWTSSYSLVAAGWSLLLLSLFYYLIDVRGCNRWCFFFVVIGMNAITIYVGQKILNFDSAAGFFVAGVAGHFPAAAAIILAASALSLKWLALWFLYRRRVFLRL